MASDAAPCRPEDNSINADASSTDASLAPLIPLPPGDDNDLWLPTSTRGRRTRRQLLDAAESVFGADGYEGASVAAITTAAGVAHGSFYTYFPSKRAIFVELIRGFEARIRRAVSASAHSVAPETTRAELEWRALDESFRYVLAYPALYRVVCEAALFAPETHRWYFTSFVAAYVAAYRDVHADQRDVETLGWLMVSIADMFALRWVIWEGQVPPDHVRRELRRFLARGFGSAPPLQEEHHE